MTAHAAAWGYDAAFCARAAFAATVQLPVTAVEDHLARWQRTRSPAGAAVAGNSPNRHCITAGSGHPARSPFHARNHEVIP